MGGLESVPVILSATTAGVKLGAYLYGLYKDRKPGKALNIKGSTKSSIEKMRKKAQEKLGINSVDDYNFAIAGRAKVGKSTLIYSVLGGRDACTANGLTPNTPTDDIRSYRHWDVALGHMVFWDLPGAGTPQHPAHSYFMDKHLYAFDFIIIVTDARFMEYDFQLVKDARKHDVPVVFVRNKADVDIASYRVTHRDVSEAEAIVAVRESCRKSFMDQAKVCKIGSDCRLFTISARSKVLSTVVGHEAAQSVDDVPRVDEAELVQYVSELAYQNRN